MSIAERGHKRLNPALEPTAALLVYSIIAAVRTRAPRPTVLALLLFSIVARSAETTANWPQFRGPGAMGVADHPGLPDRWSTNENVAWKVDVAGRDWSSPIV